MKHRLIIYLLLLSCALNGLLVWQYFSKDTAKTTSRSSSAQTDNDSSASTLQNKITTLETDNNNLIEYRNKLISIISIQNPTEYRSNKLILKCPHDVSQETARILEIKKLLNNDASYKVAGPEATTQQKTDIEQHNQLVKESQSLQKNVDDYFSCLSKAKALTVDDILSNLGL